MFFSQTTITNKTICRPVRSKCSSRRVTMIFYFQSGVVLHQHEHLGECGLRSHCTSGGRGPSVCPGRVVRGIHQNRILGRQQVHRIHVKIKTNLSRHCLFVRINGLQCYECYSGATPLFSMRTESLVSSQSCSRVEFGAWCKQALRLHLLKLGMQTVKYLHTENTVIVKHGWVEISQK